MRRAAGLAVVGTSLAAVALAVVAWQWRSARSLPCPPTLADPGLVDPEVAALVNQTLQKISQSPYDPSLRVKLAMIYDANSLTDLARISYDQVLAADPSNTKAWFHLARTLAELGDLKGAIDAVDRAISLDSSYSPAHWRRGLWLLQLGRVDEAEAAFHHATQADPDDPSGWTGLVRVFLSRGAYEQAVELLRGRVIAVWPDYGYARRLLGTAYRHLGRTAEARRELARGRGSEPVWRDPWQEHVKQFGVGYGTVMKRADTLMGNRQFGQALELLIGLRETHPSSPDLLNKTAEAHFALARPDRAADVLKVAANIAPKHFPTHLNLSLAYEQTNNARLALHHVDRAIALNPTSGPAYLQKARLFIIVENYESGLEPLEQAVRFGAMEPDVMIMLGHVQARLNRWQEAGDTFEMVTQQHPDQASAFAMLARARGEVGAMNEAWTALRQAAEVDSQEPLLQPTAARLRQLQARPAPSSDR